MKNVEDESLVCKSVFKIYALDKKGWWCFSLLGEHKTRSEAEEALKKYLGQPENRPSSPEMYQIRKTVTLSILFAEVTHHPDGTIVTNSRL